ncbi:helix-turn-helix domain-containing protein [Patescibacteria group bacterium]
MKSIGEFMTSARADRQITLDKIESTTKIKRSFIFAIEKQEWGELPDYPVVLGFVKVLADLYEVDGQKAVALLRRDYPPQKMHINPKPDIEKRFVWSPKLTFALALIFVISVVTGYLGYQFYQYRQPPVLEIYTPTSDQIVTVDLIEVSGLTHPDSSVVVNNQPVFVDEGGNFSTSLNVSEQTNQVEITSKLRSGRETNVNIPIEVSLK